MTVENHEFSQDVLTGLDLKPADATQEAPDYEFAGTSLGGEMVYSCGACGCILRESLKDVHTFHHQKVNALIHHASAGVVTT